jgi:hypothetical protein
MLDEINANERWPWGFLPTRRIGATPSSPGTPHGCIGIRPTRRADHEGLCATGRSGTFGSGVCRDGCPVRIKVTDDGATKLAVDAADGLSEATAGSAQAEMLARELESGTPCSAGSLLLFAGVLRDVEGRCRVFGLIVWLAGDGLFRGRGG